MIFSSCFTTEEGSFAFNSEAVLLEVHISSLCILQEESLIERSVFSSETESLQEVIRLAASKDANENDFSSFIVSSLIGE